MNYLTYLPLIQLNHETPIITCEIISGNEKKEIGITNLIYETAGNNNLLSYTLQGSKEMKIVERKRETEAATC